MLIVNRILNYILDQLKKNFAASFICMTALFGVSGLIGVYFWRKGNQTTPEETLLGKNIQWKRVTWNVENDKNDRWRQEMFYQEEIYILFLCRFNEEICRFLIFFLPKLR